MSYYTLCVCVRVLNHVRLLVILWVVTCQAPLSMGFFRKEYWSGLPRPPPGDLPDPGIEHTSLKSTCIGKWVSFLPLVPPGKPFFCLERQNGSYPLGIPTAGCVFHSIVAVVQSCSSLCNPVYCSRPGSSVLHYLLEFAQIHVH